MNRVIEKIEESGEELMTNETRGGDLSQSEEYEDGETVKFKSRQSIYDETNLMYNESCLLSTTERSTYSLAAKQKVWRDAMQ